MKPTKPTKPTKTLLGLAFAALAALGTLAACGNETGGSPDDTDGGGGTGRYLPLAVGATWTWRVTDSAGTSYDKSSTVEALEDIGGQKAGTMGFRVRTKGGGGDTLSWQQDTGTSIVRHREQDFHVDGSMKTDSFYMPFKLRVDESAAHLAAGVDYELAFTEIAKKIADGSTQTLQKGETWSVVSVDEQVTVPAGSFHCLHLHRVATDDAAGASKDYWFARGVGKIKETGGQTEELASYSLPAAP
jgi:hypothetical protein